MYLPPPPPFLLCKTDNTEKSAVPAPSAWRYLRKVSPITTRSLLAKGAGVGDADEAVSSDGKKTSSISGIGGTGSNLLLILSSVLVIKGLLLPEDIRWVFPFFVFSRPLFLRSRVSVRVLLHYLYDKAVVWYYRRG